MFLNRGHAVLTFYLEIREYQLNELILSKLHLVDLAGAENLSGSSKKSSEKDISVDENHHINLSLSALGKKKI